MLKLLIIAHAFPPQNATASHRAYSWARTWADLGHEVHVLTPTKNAFDGSLDMQADMAGIRVHEVPYLLARRRAQHTDGVEPGALSRAQRLDWIKTLTRRARFSLAMFGDPRLLAYFAMRGAGMRILAAGGFNFIVATSPPELTFFVARSLSRRTGTPWIADFRDLWFRDMRLHQSWMASSLSGVVNRWLVGSAALLVTVSRGLQKRLAAYLQRDVRICYNGFFESEVAASGAVPHWNDDKAHVVYTGRMYPGKRDPEPLFRAMAKLKADAPHCAGRLVVDFYGFDDPWLRALIARHQLHEQVVVHGFVPFRTSVAIQRAADVLLFLDWTDAQAEGILTGKLFEYLATRRPILSVGRHKDTEAAQLIAETRCGITLTSEEEISTYLRTLAESARPPDVEPQGVGPYSREKQARDLLRVLRELPRARS
ncbi:MAG: glycosyltransferase [Betaproteobacteria bacterium]